MTFLSRRSRRSPARFAAAPALALVATMALVACGSASDDGDDVPMRTVESTFDGTEVEVPVDPQRVVTLWRTGTIVADLGVVPVASLEGEFLEEELGTEVYADYDDIPTVGSFEGVDIEKLLEADPDLVIGMDHGGLSIDYDEIAKHVPVVVLEIAEPTDVWNNYPLVADILGKTTEYEQKNAQLDADLAAIKNEFGDVIGNLQVTNVGMTDNTVYIDTSKSLTYARLHAAGFGYNSAYTDNPERYAEELALENLPDLASQDAIFYDVDIDGAVPAENQALLDTESFGRLPAAEAGHVYGLTSGTIYTFAAAQKQVADLRSIAEKLSAGR